MDEVYGRSPMVTALPAWRAMQEADQRDIELMINGDTDRETATAAQERFMARRRPLWRAMGLI